jgi:hypothetical protein
MCTFVNSCYVKPKLAKPFPISAIAWAFDITVELIFFHGPPPTRYVPSSLTYQNSTISRGGYFFLHFASCFSCLQPLVRPGQTKKLIHLPVCKIFCRVSLRLYTLFQLENPCMFFFLC